MRENRKREREREREREIAMIGEIMVPMSLFHLCSISKMQNRLTMFSLTSIQQNNISFFKKYIPQGLRSSERLKGESKGTQHLL